MKKGEKCLQIPARGLKEPHRAYAEMPVKRFEFFKDQAHAEADVICLSHLRWDFVYQRPQHLLSRCARERRVFFFEEPIYIKGQMAQFDLAARGDNLFVIQPLLPMGLSEDEAERAQQAIINELIAEKEIKDYLLWYYTPMALGFTRHLKPLATVYDCMDELSAFRGAPRTMAEREAELLKRADVVFTGGQSLYEAKRHQHHNIHPFPSSIDAAHFAQARFINQQPPDQAAIPRPRLGFFGVIDERMDIELLDRVATLRPDWQFVMIGPVVKVDPADLPRRPNLHYLGSKEYKELPAYIAGWDVALMPFAMNESTRFISPTKTPEYLAAGKPVVSTPVRDVVRVYGEMGLVRIAERPEAFVEAIEAALREDIGNADLLMRVDELLARTSWDWTWTRMAELIKSAIAAGRRPESIRQVAAGASISESESEAHLAAD
ncbi:MAG TPA: glycosyltransferase family 1 protein [Blastocatellia bacterium]|nr:glycosyltransferase family 1 protein [Blastocatellia bacterium]